MTREPHAWRARVRALVPGSVLRAMDRHRIYQRVACARMTDRPLRFLVRDLRGGGTLHHYRLRRTGAAFWLHHGTEDLGVLDEVFRLGFYEPPVAVRRAVDAMPRPPRVLDLGGHIGMFGLFAFERLRAGSVLAFEPDAANRDALVRTIAANGIAERWEVRAAAAGVAAGQAAFAGGLSSGSRLAAGAGTLVPVTDVLPEIRDADVVKIDIEGGEWPILADERFAAARPPVVVLEYHPEGREAAGGELRAGRPGDAVRRLLTSCGYATFDIFEEPSGVGMLWGLSDDAVRAAR